MKKKLEKTENIAKSSITNKIFNIIIINDNLYFLDKELNLIWDNNADVIGFINNNNYVFFDTISQIINNIEQDKNLIII